ncbi:unnamed protein product [Choristocarpus tenellus]
MGCEISRDRTAQTVTISQTRYIKSVCQRFGMDGAKKRSVPHDLSRTLDKSESHPTIPKSHWRAVRCILAYLNACPSVGLSFGGFYTECELSAYADASYAGDWNDCRSVTGGAISWMSKIQRVVALSSTESEYMALSSVTRKLLFLGSIFEFIQSQFPRCCVELFEDNDGACKLVRNATSSTRTKHIDVQHHLLRDLSRKGEIHVVFVGTAYQRAQMY